MNENQNEYVDVNVHDNYPDSEQTINVPTMKVAPLKRICMTIGEIPTSYLETMSYYEMLVWFIHFLRDTVIPTVNENAEAVQEVQTVVMDLQTYINNFKDSIDQDMEELEEYVNNYFETVLPNLVNDKIDELVEDGTIESILLNYARLIKVYNTHAEMIADKSTFINGLRLKTLGYHSIGDNGGANYIVTNVEDNTKYQEDLENNLYLEIINKEIFIDMFGCYGDNTHDDSTNINLGLSYFKKINFSNKTYLISSQLNISNNDIIGNNTTIKASSSLNDYMSVLHGDVSLKNIKFDCDDNSIGCVNQTTDLINLNIDNCEFTGAKEYTNESGFAQNSSCFLSGKFINVTNSKFNDNKSHGARLIAKHDDTIVNIDNCEFNNNGTRGEITAIGLVQYDGSNGTKFEKVTISNCYAIDNANTGLAPHSCNNIIITSCVCNDNGEHGICLMDGKNGIISNCICKNNYKYGIRIQGDYNSNDAYHGYKNCSINDCFIEGQGFDIDENINGINIVNNTIMYKETGLVEESMKAIRIGRVDRLTSYVKNANIINNYIYNYQIYPIQCFITLENDVNFYNYINGNPTNLYKHGSDIFYCNSSSNLKYGTTDNILAYPTDFSHWTLAGDASISNNVITRGTSNLIARYTQEITTPPRYVSVIMKFSDYDADADGSIGFRFRNSSNTTIAELFYMIRLKGNYMCRVFDTSKVENLDATQIAKVEPILSLSKGSIKMHYCYVALSNDVPIIPNIAE